MYSNYASGIFWIIGGLLVGLVGLLEKCTRLLLRCGPLGLNNEHEQ